MNRFASKMKSVLTSKTFIMCALATFILCGVGTVVYTTITKPPENPNSETKIELTEDTTLGISILYDKHATTVDLVDDTTGETILLRQDKYKEPSGSIIYQSNEDIPETKGAYFTADILVPNEKTRTFTLYVAKGENTQMSIFVNKTVYSPDDANASRNTDPPKNDDYIVGVTNTKWKLNGNDELGLSFMTKCSDGMVEITFVIIAENNRTKELTQLTENDNCETGTEVILDIVDTSVLRKGETYTVYAIAEAPNGMNATGVFLSDFSLD
jgi:hypothetical protein